MTPITENRSSDAHTWTVSLSGSDLIEVQMRAAEIFACATANMAEHPDAEILSDATGYMTEYAFAPATWGKWSITMTFAKARTTEDERFSIVPRYDLGGGGLGGGSLHQGSDDASIAAKARTTETSVEGLAALGEAAPRLAAACGKAANAMKSARDDINLDAPVMTVREALEEAQTHLGSVVWYSLNIGLAPDEVNCKSIRRALEMVTMALKGDRK